MKRIITTLLLICGFGTMAIAEVNQKTLAPIYQERTMNAFTLYNLPNSSATSTGVTLYVVGGATTSAVAYYVGTTSLTITTTGGLYPGTTTFLFADTRLDTLSELLNYANVLSTSVVGSEGGIVMSTASVAYGAVLSARLTAGQSGTCKGLSNRVNLTVTPAAGQTAKYEIGLSTIGFITTNGLFPGSTVFTFAGTVAQFQARLAALPSTTPGIDGTLTMERVQGAYDGNLATDLFITTNTAISIREVGNKKTLPMETVYGISYILPASALYISQQYHVTGLSVNATFGSGSTYVNVYDGATESNTQLLKYQVPTTAVQTNILNIPANGNFAGSKNTALRIDVVGSAAVTAGNLNIIGYKD
jgi:hypothetical protein